MKQQVLTLLIPLLLTACEQAEESGHEAVRDITGSHLIQQGKQVQQQLHDIDQQQQGRFKQLDQQ